MPVYKLRIKELNPDFVKELQTKFGDAEVELRVYPTASETPGLTDGDFWHVISLLDWDQEENEAILEPALNFLSQKSESNIQQFQEMLAQKLFALDKKVFAENLGEDAYQNNHPFSPDYFLYARACVVANGKEYYQRVLNDPRQMPEGYTFEPLLSLAKKAYFRKTKKTFEYRPSVSYETFSNPEGWEETLVDKLS